MWIGNTIYFNSDRDDHFNLYAYDVAKGSTTQITTNKTWDVRWPSSDNQGRIVYELNGELQIFDTKSKKNTPISITVPDDGLNRRPSRVSGRQSDLQLRRSVRRASAPCLKRVVTSSPRRLKRAGAQPDQFLQRARQAARLVARRLADRLHLRQDRRRRALRHGAGWLEACGTTDERRQGDAVCARLVARWQAASPSATRTARSIR